jgi:hypothetical protein
MRQERLTGTAVTKSIRINTRNPIERNKPSQSGGAVVSISGLSEAIWQLSKHFERVGPRSAQPGVGENPTPNPSPTNASRRVEKFPIAVATTTFQIDTRISAIEDWESY